MRLFFHAVALSSALVACGSSGIPSIDPPPSDGDGGGSPTASAEGQASSSAQPDPGAAASGADAGSGTSLSDGAAGPASGFELTIDGAAQKVTQTRAVYMPTERWLGVRAHVAASSTAPEGDVVVLFNNTTAAGNVSCAQAQIMFQTTMGKQYSATGDASCQLTGVAIGPVGGMVEGSFNGTLRAHQQSSSMNVTFSFSVLRAPDSEVL